MKYIMICVIVLASCLVCAWLPAWRIGKAKRLKRGVTLLLMFAFALLLICGITFGYLSVYYPADAVETIATQTVQMEKIDGGYFFDGPGEDTALIFYPGAKVETLAYASLLISLAEQGIDCFLADMPFRMAIFGSNLADQFLNHYSYNHWAAAGHSMGGLVISGYAASHADQISHLILLAAYPGSAIPDSISLCSIYGTQDGCLNLDAYEKAKVYWPTSAEEVLLQGGNHAQYGNYGPQSGDLEPEISREEQQALTVERILTAIGEA